MADGRCLPSAAQHLKNLKNVTVRGVDMPLGIWALSWPSSWLASHVMLIIAKDMLGYEAALGPGGQVSSTAINALAGCKIHDDCLHEPLNDADEWRYHLAFETWEDFAAETVEGWRNLQPFRAPIIFRDIGYAGVEDTYVPPSVIAGGMAGAGLTLDYYRSYNASKSEPWLFFDSIADFDRSSLTECTALKDAVSAQGSLYTKWFPEDTSGYEVDTSGSFSMKCFNQTWWLAPACRSEPSNCVPWLTAHVGSGVVQAMQRSVRYNMPLALGFIDSATTLHALVRSRRALFYHPQPSVADHELDAMARITFPMHDEDEYANGMLATAAPAMRLDKWAMRGLQASAAEAYAVAQRMRISTKAMKSMLSQVAAGSSYYAAACDWLRNTADWRAWVFDSSECVTGQGLGDDNKRPVETRGNATSCVWCPLGKYSWYHEEEHSWLCRPCPTGQFSPGVGATACQNCTAGRFSSEAGQTECTLCPKGLFTSSPGSVACQICPAGMLTAETGSTGVAACLCPRGEFLDNSRSPPSCTSCGFIRTTAGSGAVSDDECILDWHRILPHAALLLALLSLSIAPLFAIYIHRRNQHKRERQDMMEAMRQNLKQGYASTSTLQFPMSLIALNCFCDLSLNDVSECYEGARDVGKLLTLDSVGQIHRFKASGRTILFLSYTWLSYESLGPNDVQLKCMQAAARKICTEQGHDPEAFYVWLDVLGIPQAHENCKKLAVDSLYVYASNADYLVAICPSCRHAQTNEDGGIDMYKSRVWCRVEQVAHCCTNGFSRMSYSTSPGELHPIDENWIQDVLYIFEGEVTCCRLRHPGDRRCDKELLVPTVLAMYRTLSAKIHEGCILGDDVYSVWEMITNDHDRVFPQTFQYRTAADDVRTKQLFGKLISWIDGMLSTEACSYGMSGTLSLSSRGLKKGRSGRLYTMNKSKSSGRLATASMGQVIRRSVSQQQGVAFTSELEKELSQPQEENKPWGRAKRILDSKRSFQSNRSEGSEAMDNVPSLPRAFSAVHADEVEDGGKASPSDAEDAHYFQPIKLMANAARALTERTDTSTSSPSAATPSASSNSWMHAIHPVDEAGFIALEMPDLHEEPAGRLCSRASC
eukprot:TRINITY_DN29459_c0_g2_i1.p1 TRINITY_DN29459_c0_g2~~TRINITY_DN29459_c0_g2_i1.p1  ORF type:complete len:1104 (+),score=92.11 TRINITY_DN29459_c0_g2_i1:95-3406(+)